MKFKKTLQVMDIMITNFNLHLTSFHVKRKVEIAI